MPLWTEHPQWMRRGPSQMGFDCLSWLLCSNGCEPLNVLCLHPVQLEKNKHGWNQ